MTIRSHRSTSVVQLLIRSVALSKQLFADGPRRTSSAPPVDWNPSLMLMASCP